MRRPSARPIENLRPQHLVEALFWTAIPEDMPVLFEAGDEATARYYTLTVVQNASIGSTTDSGEWKVGRKIWFDRTDLNIARLEIYDPDGNVTEDIQYRHWTSFGTVRFPAEIDITRPAEDYGLVIGITRLIANQPITADKFQLTQPAGSELIDVGDQPKSPELKH